MLNLSRLVLMSVLIGSIVLAQGAPFQRTSNYANMLKQDLLYASSMTPAKSIATIMLHYADPKSVADQIKLIFPTAQVASDPRIHAIIVVTDASTLTKIRRMITQLDRPVSQLRFEVQVLEVSSLYLLQNKALFSDILSNIQLGLDQNTGHIISPTQIGIAMSHLLASGNARILAKPTILTTDGTKATIKVGDRTPYITQILYERYTTQEVHFAETGITLEILPRVATRNNIYTDIMAEMNAVKLWKKIGDSEYPIMSNRKTTTKVYLSPGQTLVLAGLYDEQTKQVTAGPPVLKDIPIIGDLFRYKSYETYNTDILIFITPYWGSVSRPIP
jgi:type II secretory pathway component GspD/PulD (secretin)